VKSLHASSDSDLAPILDYVHDRTYDIERVVLDAERRELRIPVYLGSRQCEGTLLIKSALRFELKDDAEIGEGDINTISHSGGRVEINGAIPVKLSIEVERFDLEFIVPDNAPPA